MACDNGGNSIAQLSTQFCWLIHIHSVKSVSQASKATKWWLSALLYKTSVHGCRQHNSIQVSALQYYETGAQAAGFADTFSNLRRHAKTWWLRWRVAD